MAVSTWRIRHQNIRSGRSRLSKRSEHAEDINKLLNEDPHESFKKVLCKIYQDGIGNELLLNYLNAFVKLILRLECKFEDTGYSTEDILCCLRALLTHESTQIRSGGMRCIRHVLKTEDDIIIMNKLLVPYLITRCLDLVMKYDVERMEAMKLMRKALILSPSTFDISMARNLVAMANEGSEGKDRMLRICLATLCELGILNSSLFISCGGVAAITRNLLECQTPKIAESLCGVLLLLLDRPETRNCARIDLHSVAAPFCDFHYKHIWRDKNRRDERELRLNCSRLALLTILRSWPGILHFCSPNDNTGFKAIVDVLHLNQLEVRKAVLDLLYELLGLQQPEWSDELSVALSAVDPCEPQASWRLNEGFIAAEGRSILPHLTQTMPSTSDIHLALLLYSFLECGLLEALTEVIATSDTFISVRATVLLGELLRLVQILLPPSCCNISPSLPALLEYATRSKPQAMSAITALQQYHKLMKQRPASYSLHLDYILRSGNPRLIPGSNAKSVKHKNSSIKTKLSQFVLKSSDDIVKDTRVLLSNDAFTWDWNLINVLLGVDHRSKIDIQDSSHKTFIKRLVEFFMPSKNKYSHMDLSTSSLIYTTTGIELIDYLINTKDAEYTSIVLELFKDILNNILAITNSKSVHDCLFSPLHMVNTQCQSYFLFIGRFAATKIGSEMLTTIDMFNQLEKLATTTNHDCYVKLIVSSLDYTIAGPCRQILEAVLVCPVESSRLYATQFLLILLRAGIAEFSSWGVRLLVKQLDDKSRSINLSALAALHEACEMPDCLDTLIILNPNLDKLGEKGMLLCVRFLSTECGLTSLTSDVIKIVNKWESYFNFRYVKMAEGDMSDTLTLHQRNEDGKYDKRASSNSARSMNRKDVFLPPHLYGQLGRHAEGFKVLLSHANMEQKISCIESAKIETDAEIMELKSSLWAIGHLSSTTQGLDFLRSRNILGCLVRLAEKSPVYSIRATSFYVLSLAGITSKGADELYQLGWVCTRHNRHDYWPILIEEKPDTLFSDCLTIMSEEPLSLGHYDMDNIYEEESEELYSGVTSPDGKRIRQLTLPTSKKPLLVTHHQRSLSESKTFDWHDLSDDRNTYVWRRRFRNVSFTDSTTSGVSSCDSHTGFRLGICDQPLSPIPSSTSLRIKSIDLDSDLSPRVSTNSGTHSDVSSSGSFSNMFPRIRFGSFGKKFLKLEKDFVDFRTWSALNDSTSQEGSETDVLDTTFASMFTIQKLPTTSNQTECDKYYIGISLPQVLTVLFPDERKPNDSFTKSLSEVSLSHTISLHDVYKHVEHNKLTCFKCGRIKEPQPSCSTERTDTQQVEVYRNIEKLANPGWNRHAKQVLLHIKQLHPEVFKDLCVYSHSFTLLNEIAYRLASRRFIHELFLDVAFKNLYEEPKNILVCDAKKGVHKTEAS